MAERPNGWVPSAPDTTVGTPCGPGRGGGGPSTPTGAATVGPMGARAHPAAPMWWPCGRNLGPRRSTAGHPVFPGLTDNTGGRWGTTKNQVPVHLAVGAGGSTPRATSSTSGGREPQPRERSLLRWPRQARSAACSWTSTTRWSTFPELTRPGAGPRPHRRQAAPGHGGRTPDRYPLVPDQRDFFRGPPCDDALGPAPRGTFTLWQIVGGPGLDGRTRPWRVPARALGPGVDQYLLADHRRGRSSVSLIPLAVRKPFVSAGPSA